MPTLITLSSLVGTGNATSEKIRVKNKASEIVNVLKRGDHPFAMIETEQGQTIYLNPDHVVSVVDLPRK